MSAAVDRKKKNATLSLRVPLDQSLETRIASQRVPNRIKSQDGNCDSIWRAKRTLKELKRGGVFACQRIDLSERNGRLWPVESILRFGQKLNGTFALGDGQLL